MPQRPHVLDLALHPGPRLRRIDDLLRDKLHGDFVSCDSVYRHFGASVNGLRGRAAELTLDLAERSLRNLLDDSVLSKLRRRKRILNEFIFAHGRSFVDSAMLRVVVVKRQECWKIAAGWLTLYRFSRRLFLLLH